MRISDWSSDVCSSDLQTITWSPHDLRRTALTILEAMDVSAYALKRIAAHSQQSDVTAGYLSDDVHRLRAPMERLESVALPGKGKSHIVPMRRKKSAGAGSGGNGCGKSTPARQQHSHRERTWSVPSYTPSRTKERRGGKEQDGIVSVDDVHT